MTHSDFSLIHQLGDNHIAELLELYQHEWWSQNRVGEDVRAMLAHSDHLFGLVEARGGRLVAFARVLTDRVYKAFVFDVIVHPDYRGAGLGRTLLDSIFAHPDLSSVETVELYCLPDLIPFYSRWGFTSDIAGCVFLRRRRK